MESRKQYAHDTKLSFCERSRVILAGDGSITQENGKQIVLQMHKRVAHTSNIWREIGW